ncbi:hypothetical protein NQZ68_008838 [Dissostichus eleginoides]|nr:hypothetical protein NQZ68_008838 [Dissostichus eleginoides]
MLSFSDLNLRRANSRVGHKAEAMRSNYRVDSLNKISKAKSPESNAGGAGRGTKRRRDALAKGGESEEEMRRGYESKQQKEESLRRRGGEDMRANSKRRRV